MATNKNITMKQFNGTDYDTLYPKTKVEQVEDAYSQQQILADSTKALYGLGTDAVPDDVFFAIALSKGRHIVRVTASFSNGTPADDVIIQGIQPITGSEVRTNANGIGVGYTEADSIVVSVKDYIGINDASVTAESSGSNDIIDVSLTLTKNTDIVTIEESCEKYIHKSAVLLDLCSVGGGAAGGDGGNRGTSGPYGAGGGGGYVGNNTGISAASVKKIVIAVGAGGNSNGASGGTTTVKNQNGDLLSQASGGGPGAGGNGAGGSGDQYNPTSGGNSADHIFNDSSLALAGGGGGGGGTIYGYTENSGGAPYGGKGGKDNGAQAGQGPGGGGGGGPSTASGAHWGAAGHCGAVYARVRY